MSAYAQEGLVVLVAEGRGSTAAASAEAAARTCSEVVQGASDAVWACAIGGFGAHTWT